MDKLHPPVGIIGGLFRRCQPPDQLWQGQAVVGFFTWVGQVGQLEGDKREFTPQGALPDQADGFFASLRTEVAHIGAAGVAPGLPLNQQAAFLRLHRLLRLPAVDGDHAAVGLPDMETHLAEPGGLRSREERLYVSPYHYASPPTRIFFTRMVGCPAPINSAPLLL